jgi:hypothetical protein
VKVQNQAEEIQKINAERSADKENMEREMKEMIEKINAERSTDKENMER